MTPTHVRPPRGAVKLTDHRPGGGWQVDCTNCGYHHPPAPYVSTRTDAEEAKRNHRCQIEDTVNARNSAGGRAGVAGVDPDGVARLTQERDKLAEKVRKLKRRNEELAEEIDDLEFRNEKLVEEIDELRVDPGEFWEAVTSIHWDTPNTDGPGLLCAHDGHRWPCPTIDALERIN